MRTAYRGWTPNADTDTHVKQQARTRIPIQTDTQTLRTPGGRTARVLLRNTFRDA